MPKDEKKQEVESTTDQPKKLPEASITRINPAALPVGIKRHIEIFGQNFLNTTDVVITECNSSFPPKDLKVVFYKNKLDVYITVEYAQEITFILTYTDKDGERHTIENTFDFRELKVNFYEQPKAIKFPFWKKLLIGFGMIAIICTLAAMIKSCQHGPEIVNYSPTALQPGVIATVEITTSKPLNLESQNNFYFPDGDVLLLKVVTEKPKQYQLKVQPLATCKGSRSVYLFGTDSFATFRIGSDEE